MLLENQSFRNKVGLKPKSFSTHYQAEIARVSNELKKSRGKKETQDIGFKKRGRKIKKR